MKPLISFEEWGKQHGGPPIVLIHGFPLDRQIFADVAARLSETHHVVAPDMPGFGKSSGPAPDTLDEFARQIRSFIAEHHLLPCVLGGLSMGGYVSLAYHRLFASDLRGLILLDTKSAADTPKARDARTRLADLGRSEGATAVREQMLPKMFCEATVRSKPELVSSLGQTMATCPTASIVSGLTAMKNRPDFTSDLPHMSIPLLMITGQYDILTPPDVGRAVAAVAANGTYVEIPGAGHVSTMEQPEQVAAAIRDFYRMMKP